MSEGQTGALKVFCLLAFVCLPLPVSQLLPPSVAGEDDDGEEDCSRNRCQYDDNDRHGVSR